MAISNFLLSPGPAAKHLGAVATLGQQSALNAAPREPVVYQ